MRIVGLCLSLFPVFIFRKDHKLEKTAYWRVVREQATPIPSLQCALLWAEFNKIICIGIGIDIDPDNARLLVLVLN